MSKNQDTFSHDSLFGTLSFDSNGDVAYPFFLKAIRNGEFVVLE